ncbi:MAG: hypothetical protein V1750_02355, partial [Acidobacteriota bacterium]
MRELEELGEAPASGEEISAAERLGRALAGASEAATPAELIAAAQLLAAVGGADVADDVARVRLRRELVAAARARRPRWQIGVAAVAAALIVAALGAVLLRSPSATDARARGAPQAAARAARA